MARNAVAIVSVALAAFALSGCGTLYNSAFNSQRVYGGVITDGELAACAAKTAREETRPLDLLNAALPLADVPLSFVADTALLPYAMSIRYDRQLYPFGPPTLAEVEKLVGRPVDTSNSSLPMPAP
jgi:uncharacterized protein YceK